jgi:uncharacterized protein with gpF-like domain
MKMTQTDLTKAIDFLEQEAYKYPVEDQKRSHYLWIAQRLVKMHYNILNLISMLPAGYTYKTYGKS